MNAVNVRIGKNIRDCSVTDAETGEPIRVIGLKLEVTSEGRAPTEVWLKLRAFEVVMVDVDAEIESTKIHYCKPPDAMLETSRKLFGKPE